MYTHIINMDYLPEINILLYVNYKIKSLTLLKQINFNKQTREKLAGNVTVLCREVFC